MAPDLDSLPPSPYYPRQASSASSRRDSESAGPQTYPTSSFTRLALSAPRDSSSNVLPDNTGVGTGPGPIRHPRPLTAAELHMQLEKEQEAVVNRLTRELSLLRAQTASVASTASSTSTGHPEVTDYNIHHMIHPTSSRRHRSSSNLSTRSANTSAATATGIAGASGTASSTTGGLQGSAVSGIAPARDNAALPQYGRDPLSRQSSAASRRSEASSPSLSSSFYQGDHFPNLYAHRNTGSTSYPQNAPSQQTPNSGSARSSYVPSTHRYDEAAHHRAELEFVKRENEMLRRRIRELERSMSSRRGSLSTSASVPPHGRDSAVGADEDAVNVGESASSTDVNGER